MPQGIECYRDGDYEAGNPPFFDSVGGYILGSAALSGSGFTVTDANFANGTPFWYVTSSSGWALAPTPAMIGPTTLNVPAHAGFTGTLYYGIR